MNIQRLIKNTTPFIILSILALLALIYISITKHGGSAAMGGLFIVFPLTEMGVMLVGDFSLKRMLKAKLGWIWLIKIILMIACIYWWIIT